MKTGCPAVMFSPEAIPEMSGTLVIAEPSAAGYTPLFHLIAFEPDGVAEVSSFVTYLLEPEAEPEVPTKADFSFAVGSLVEKIEVAKVDGLTNNLAEVSPAAVPASI